MPEDTFSHGADSMIPASIFYKSIADRYRPVSYPDGPIMARYRFIKNAYWDMCVHACPKASASPFLHQMDVSNNCWASGFTSLDTRLHSDAALYSI